VKHRQTVCNAFGPSHSFACNWDHCKSEARSRILTHIKVQLHADSETITAKRDARNDPLIDHSDRSAIGTADCCLVNT
jgi:hypothetical protein